MAADACVTDMSDLKDLEPISKRLNAASDELTKALESIQQRLNTLALGVEAWLDQEQRQELARDVDATWVELEGRRVDHWDDDAKEFITWRRSVKVQELGYGRLGDGWALLVRTMSYFEAKDADGWSLAPDEPSSETERKPLLRSGRQIRVKAVDLIPDLIAILQREATSVIDAVEKAKKIADSLQ